MTATEPRTFRPSSEVREAALEQMERVTGLRDLDPEKRSETYARQLREETARLDSLDREFDLSLAAEDAEIRRAVWEHAVANPPAPRGEGPTAANSPAGRSEFRTPGELVVTSDAYTEWASQVQADSITGTEHRMPAFEYGGRSYLADFLNGAYELRTLIDGAGDAASGDAAMLRPLGTPIPPVPRQRRLFVRDLLSVQTTTLANINYVRELNPATNETGASSVAEAAAKPEVTMEFEDADAPVRKIAAWVPVTEEILADAPTLAGYINTRLAYMLAVREELEIIDGNGVAPDLTGIRTISGTQTQSSAGNDEVYETIAQAIGKVENVDGDADGVAMNPTDFWATVGLRHANQMDSPAIGTAPSGRPALTIWGLPVVRTRALATTEVLVASWAMGATVFDRLRTTIRQSNSHSDYFVKNKVAVLAEERIALAIHRPDFFVKTTIAFA